MPYQEKRYLRCSLNIFLLKFQTETSFMLEKKSIGITSDTLSDFLYQIESSFANTFREASAEEVSKLERVAVKGFESLSFDWALCLSKYLHSSEVHVLGCY